jgi:hypothetical protein
VYPYHILYLRDEWGSTNIGGKYTLLSKLPIKQSIKQKDKCPLLFSRYFDPWEEWQEGIIDQDSKVIENRTLVIGQLYGTMDTIIMAGQIRSTHFFFANPFGDLFTPNSISPIEMLCTVFLFFLAILFS